MAYGFLIRMAMGYLPFLEDLDYDLEGMGMGIGIVAAHIWSNSAFAASFNNSARIPAFQSMQIGGFAGRSGGWS